MRSSELTVIFAGREACYIRVRVVITGFFVSRTLSLRHWCCRQNSLFHTAQRTQSEKRLLPFHPWNHKETNEHSWAKRYYTADLQNVYAFFTVDYSTTSDYYKSYFPCCLIIYKVHLNITFRLTLHVARNFFFLTTWWIRSENSLRDY